MEWLLVALTAIATLAAIAAAIGAWRKTSSAFDVSKLEDAERRATAQMNALRETFEKGLRELGQDQLRAQMEFQKTFMEATAASQDKLAASFVEFGARITAFGDRMNDASAASRKELAEALAAMRKTQEEAREIQIATLKELREELSRRLDESREKQTEAFRLFQEGVRTSLDQMREKNEQSDAAARKELNDALVNLRKTQDEGREAQIATLKQLETGVAKKMDELGEKNNLAFTKLQEGVGAGLDRMRAQNEEKLEKIRATVEEKLQTTLETRLGESFKLVSERLEQVHKGLGEMQTLASGVGDLKRVLTNVRSRGTFGEVQLAALLEQVLAPSQYKTNVATRPGSTERVEFAIVLPGRGDDETTVYLPIDAKFPQEDYLRLQEAYEVGDAAALESARRGLELRLLGEAKKINDKYIAPPDTTDFALLFLPTEGLYAEALRLPGVVERIQRECHIVVVGPTTLYAVLNSLQMGFRTLAIEKRSSEVWKILGAVKTEFGKFGQSLEGIRKNLVAATNKIDESEKRSRAVQRKLKQVEELPEEQTRLFLPAVSIELEPEEELT